MSRLIQDLLREAELSTWEGNDIVHVQTPVLITTRPHDFAETTLASIASNVQVTEPVGLISFTLEQEIRAWRNRRRKQRRRADAQPDGLAAAFCTGPQQYAENADQEAPMWHTEFLCRQGRQLWKIELYTTVQQDGTDPNGAADLTANEDVSGCLSGSQPAQMSTPLDSKWPNLASCLRLKPQDLEQVGAASLCKSKVIDSSALAASEEDVVIRYLYRLAGDKPLCTPKNTFPVWDVLSPYTLPASTFVPPAPALKGTSVESASKCFRGALDILEQLYHQAGKPDPQRHNSSTLHFQDLLPHHPNLLPIRDVVLLPANRQHGPSMVIATSRPPYTLYTLIRNRPELLLTPPLPPTLASPNVLATSRGGGGAGGMPTWRTAPFVTGALSEGRFSPRMWLTYQILHVVRYLHAHGITHRCISPEAIHVNDEYWLMLTPPQLTASKKDVGYATSLPVIIQEAERTSDRKSADESMLMATRFRSHWSRLPSPTSGRRLDTYAVLTQGRTVPPVLLWQVGLISNFDYILELNRLAGRGWGAADANSHPLIPWVVDFASTLAVYEHERHIRLLQSDSMRHLSIYKDLEQESSNRPRSDSGVSANSDRRVDSTDDGYQPNDEQPPDDEIDKLSQQHAALEHYLGYQFPFESLLQACPSPSIPSDALQLRSPRSAPDECSEALPRLVFRDLSVSKHRLKKGDAQLDLTYSTAHLAGLPPHHIPETLSDLTYVVYLSRVIPISQLRRAVRSRFEPMEYPSSLARLYAWTPDEAIPEHYVGSATARSLPSNIAAGLNDLNLALTDSKESSRARAQRPAASKPKNAQTRDEPDGCQSLKSTDWVFLSPEAFARWHRSVLEGPEVSARLHHWIDLVFGYKLTGMEAVASRNVHLPRQSAEHPSRHVFRTAAAGASALMHSASQQGGYEEPASLDASLSRDLYAVGKALTDPVSALPTVTTLSDPLQVQESRSSADGAQDLLKCPLYVSEAIPPTSQASVSTLLRGKGRTSGFHRSSRASSLELSDLVHSAPNEPVQLFMHPHPQRLVFLDPVTNRRRLLPEPVLRLTTSSGAWGPPEASALIENVYSESEQQRMLHRAVTQSASPKIVNSATTHQSTKPPNSKPSEESSQWTAVLQRRETAARFASQACRADGRYDYDPLVYLGERMHSLSRCTCEVYKRLCTSQMYGRGRISARAHARAVAAIHMNRNNHPALHALPQDHDGAYPIPTYIPNEHSSYWPRDDLEDALSQPPLVALGELEREAPWDAKQLMAFDAKESELGLAHDRRFRAPDAADHGELSDGESELIGRACALNTAILDKGADRFKPGTDHDSESDTDADSEPNLDTSSPAPSNDVTSTTTQCRQNTRESAAPRELSVPCLDCRLKWALSENERLAHDMFAVACVICDMYALSPLFTPDSLHTFLSAQFSILYPLDAPLCGPEDISTRVSRTELGLNVYEHTFRLPRPLARNSKALREALPKLMPLDFLPSVLRSTVRAMLSVDCSLEPPMTAAEAMRVIYGQVDLRALVMTRRPTSQTSAQQSILLQQTDLQGHKNVSVANPESLTSSSVVEPPTSSPTVPHRNEMVVDVIAQNASVLADYLASCQHQPGKELEFSSPSDRLRTPEGSHIFPQLLTSQPPQEPNLASAAPDISHETGPGRDTLIAIAALPPAPSLSSHGTRLAAFHSFFNATAVLYIQRVVSDIEIRNALGDLRSGGSTSARVYHSLVENTKSVLHTFYRFVVESPLPSLPPALLRFVFPLVYKLLLHPVSAPIALNVVNHLRAILGSHTVSDAYLSPLIRSLVPIPALAHELRPRPIAMPPARLPQATPGISKSWDSQLAHRLLLVSIPYVRAARASLPQHAFVSRILAPIVSLVRDPSLPITSGGSTNDAVPSALRDLPAGLVSNLLQGHPSSARSKSLMLSIRSQVLLSEVAAHTIIQFAKIDLHSPLDTTLLTDVILLPLLERILRSVGGGRAEFALLLRLIPLLSAQALSAMIVPYALALIDYAAANIAVIRAKSTLKTYVDIDVFLNQELNSIHRGPATTGSTVPPPSLNNASNAIGTDPAFPSLRLRTDIVPIGTMPLSLARVVLHGHVVAPIRRAGVNVNVSYLYSSNVDNAQADSVSGDSSTARESEAQSTVSRKDKGRRASLSDPNGVSGEFRGVPYEYFEYLVPTAATQQSAQSQAPTSTANFLQTSANVALPPLPPLGFAVVVDSAPELPDSTPEIQPDSVEAASDFDKPTQMQRQDHRRRAQKSIERESLKQYRKFKQSLDHAHKLLYRGISLLLACLPTLSPLRLQRLASPSALFIMRKLLLSPPFAPLPAPTFRLLLHVLTFLAMHMGKRAYAAAYLAESVTVPGDSPTPLAGSQRYDFTKGAQSRQQDGLSKSPATGGNSSSKEKKKAKSTTAVAQLESLLPLFAPLADVLEQAITGAEGEDERDHTLERVASELSRIAQRRQVGVIKSEREAAIKQGVQSTPQASAEQTKKKRFSLSTISSRERANISCLVETSLTSEGNDNPSILPLDAPLDAAITAYTPYVSLPESVQRWRVQTLAKYLTYGEDSSTGTSMLIPTGLTGLLNEHVSIFLQRGLGRQHLEWSSESDLFIAGSAGFNRVSFEVNSILHDLEVSAEMRRRQEASAFSTLFNVFKQEKKVPVQAVVRPHIALRSPRVLVPAYTQTEWKEVVALLAPIMLTSFPLQLIAQRFDPMFLRFLARQTVAPPPRQLAGLRIPCARRTDPSASCTTQDAQQTAESTRTKWFGESVYSCSIFAKPGSIAGHKRFQFKPSLRRPSNMMLMFGLAQVTRPGLAHDEVLSFVPGAFSNPDAPSSFNPAAGSPTLSLLASEFWRSIQATLSLNGDCQPYETSGEPNLRPSLLSPHFELMSTSLASTRRPFDEPAMRAQRMIVHRRRARRDAQLRLVAKGLGLVEDEDPWRTRGTSLLDADIDACFDSSDDETIPFPKTRSEILVSNVSEPNLQHRNSVSRRRNRADFLTSLASVKAVASVAEPEDDDLQLSHLRSTAALLASMSLFATCPPQWFVKPPTDQLDAAFTTPEAAGARITRPPLTSYRGRADESESDFDSAQSKCFSIATRWPNPRVSAFADVIAIQSQFETFTFGMNGPLQQSSFMKIIDIDWSKVRPSWPVLLAPIMFLRDDAESAAMCGCSVLPSFNVRTSAHFPSCNTSGPDASPMTSYSVLHNLHLLSLTLSANPLALDIHNAKEDVLNEIQRSGVVLKPRDIVALESIFYARLAERLFSKVGSATLSQPPMIPDLEGVLNKLLLEATAAAKVAVPTIVAASSPSTFDATTALATASLPLNRVTGSSGLSHDSEHARGFPDAGASTYDLRLGGTAAATSGLSGMSPKSIGQSGSLAGGGHNSSPRAASSPGHPSVGQITSLSATWPWQSSQHAPNAVGVAPQPPQSQHFAALDCELLDAYHRMSQDAALPGLAEEHSTSEVQVRPMDTLRCAFLLLNPLAALPGYSHVGLEFITTTSQVETIRQAYTSAGAQLKHVLSSLRTPHGDEQPKARGKAKPPSMSLSEAITQVVLSKSRLNQELVVTELLGNLHHQSSSSSDILSATALMLPSSYSYLRRNLNPLLVIAPGLSTYDASTSPGGRAFYGVLPACPADSAALDILSHPGVVQFLNRLVPQLKLRDVCQSGPHTVQLDPELMFTVASGASPLASLFFGDQSPSRADDIIELSAQAPASLLSTSLASEKASPQASSAQITQVATAALSGANEEAVTYSAPSSASLTSHELMGAILASSNCPDVLAYSSVPVIVPSRPVTTNAPFKSNSPVDAAVSKREPCMVPPRPSGGDVAEDTTTVDAGSNPADSPRYVEELPVDGKIMPDEQMDGVTAYAQPIDETWDAWDEELDGWERTGRRGVAIWRDDPTLSFAFTPTSRLNRAPSLPKLMRGATAESVTRTGESTSNVEDADSDFDDFGPTHDVEGSHHDDALHDPLSIARLDDLAHASGYLKKRHFSSQRRRQGYLSTTPVHSIAGNGGGMHADADGIYIETSRSKFEKWIAAARAARNAAQSSYSGTAIHGAADGPGLNQRRSKAFRYSSSTVGQIENAHVGPVTALVTPKAATATPWFVSGGADGKVKLWFVNRALRSAQVAWTQSASTSERGAANLQVSFPSGASGASSSVASPLRTSASSNPDVRAQHSRTQSRHTDIDVGRIVPPGSKSPHVGGGGPGVPPASPAASISSTSAATRSPSTRPVTQIALIEPSCDELSDDLPMHYGYYTLGGGGFGTGDGPGLAGFSGGPVNESATHVAACDGSVRVWDLETGHPLWGGASYGDTPAQAPVLPTTQSLFSYSTFQSVSTGDVETVRSKDLTTLKAADCAAFWHCLDKRHREVASGEGLGAFSSGLFQAKDGAGTQTLTNPLVQVSLNLPGSGTGPSKLSNPASSGLSSSVGGGGSGSMPGSGLSRAALMAAGAIIPSEASESLASAMAGWSAHIASSSVYQVTRTEGRLFPTIVARLSTTKFGSGVALLPFPASRLISDFSSLKSGGTLVQQFPADEPAFNIYEANDYPLPITFTHIGNLGLASAASTAAGILAALRSPLPSPSIPHINLTLPLSSITSTRAGSSHIFRPANITTCSYEVDPFELLRDSRGMNELCSLLGERQSQCVSLWSRAMARRRVDQNCMAQQAKGRVMSVTDCNSPLDDIEAELGDLAESEDGNVITRLTSRYRCDPAGLFSDGPCVTISAPHTTDLAPPRVLENWVRDDPYGAQFVLLTSHDFNQLTRGVIGWSSLALLGLGKSRLGSFSVPRTALVPDLCLDYTPEAHLALSPALHRIMAPPLPLDAPPHDIVEILNSPHSPVFPYYASLAPAFMDPFADTFLPWDSTVANNVPQSLRSSLYYASSPFARLAYATILRNLPMQSQDRIVTTIAHAPRRTALVIGSVTGNVRYIDLRTGVAASRAWRCHSAPASSTVSLDAPPSGVITVAHSSGYASAEGVADTSSVGAISFTSAPLEAGDRPDDVDALSIALLSSIGVRSVPTQTYEESDVAITRVTPSPDQPWVAASNARGEIVVFDERMGMALHNWRAHAGKCIVWAGRGGVLISAGQTSQDNSLKIWQVGHSSTVNAIAHALSFENAITALQYADDTMSAGSALAFHVADAARLRAAAERLNVPGIDPRARSVVVGMARIAAERAEVSRRSESAARKVYASYLAAKAGQHSKPASGTQVHQLPTLRCTVRGLPSAATSAHIVGNALLAVTKTRIALAELPEQHATTDSSASMGLDTSANSLDAGRGVPTWSEQLEEASLMILAETAALGAASPRHDEHNPEISAASVREEALGDNPSELILPSIHDIHDAADDVVIVSDTSDTYVPCTSRSKETSEHSLCDSLNAFISASIAQTTQPSQDHDRETLRSSSTTAVASNEPPSRSDAGSEVALNAALPVHEQCIPASLVPGTIITGSADMVNPLNHSPSLAAANAAAFAKAELVAQAATDEETKFAVIEAALPSPDPSVISLPTHKELTLVDTPRPGIRPETHRILSRTVGAPSIDGEREPHFTEPEGLLISSSFADYQPRRTDESEDAREEVPEWLCKESFTTRTQEAVLRRSRLDRFLDELAAANPMQVSSAGVVLDHPTSAALFQSPPSLLENTASGPGSKTGGLLAQQAALAALQSGLAAGAAGASDYGEAVIQATVSSASHPDPGSMLSLKSAVIAATNAANNLRAAASSTTTSANSLAAALSLESKIVATDIAGALVESATAAAAATEYPMAVSKTLIEANLASAHPLASVRTMLGTTEPAASVSQPEPLSTLPQGASAAATLAAAAAAAAPNLSQALGAGVILGASSNPNTILVTKSPVMELDARRGSTDVGQGITNASSSQAAASFAVDLSALPNPAVMNAAGSAAVSTLSAADANLALAGGNTSSLALRLAATLDNPFSGLGSSSGGANAAALASGQAVLMLGLNPPSIGGTSSAAGGSGGAPAEVEESHGAEVQAQLIIPPTASLGSSLVNTSIQVCEESVPLTAGQLSNLANQTRVQLAHDTTLGALCSGTAQRHTYHQPNTSMLHYPVPSELIAAATNAANAAAAQSVAVSMNVANEVGCADALDAVAIMNAAANLAASSASSVPNSTSVLSAAVSSTVAAAAAANSVLPPPQLVQVQQVPEKISASATCPPMFISQASSASNAHKAAAQVANAAQQAVTSISFVTSHPTLPPFPFSQQVIAAAGLNASGPSDHVLNGSQALHQTLLPHGSKDKPTGPAAMGQPASTSSLTASSPALAISTVPSSTLVNVSASVSSHSGTSESTFGSATSASVLATSSSTFQAYVPRETMRRGQGQLTTSAYLRGMDLLLIGTSDGRILFTK